jgi:hypothetical protein
MDILISNGLGVISEHVQAADIKDLVELFSSRLVLWARDGRGQLRSSRLIGEVRPLRSSKVSCGGDCADSWETS